MNGPGSQNEFAKSAGEMNIPAQMDNKDYGKKVKAVAKKVIVKSSGDGKFYGARTIMTKESFVDFLITEADDLSALPDALVAEIKSNLNAGAKDHTQKWKSALELLHTAYKVANVRRPTPDQKGAYKQYETLIQAAVKQLVKHRGLDGDWRTSNVLVREAAEGAEAHIGKRRFFIEIPGQRAAELEGTNLDEIIEQMSNKFRRHGAKIRVEERSKLGAILTVWVGEVKRDRVLIKEVS